MFAAPPVLETIVFARVPDSLSRANRKSHWVDVLQNGAPTPSFLEGPSFDRDGNLWVTDIPWGRLFKITPDGTLSLAFEYDGEPNGLKFHKDGRAFITDHKHGIMVFDPKTAKIAPYLERGRFERFKGVNDLVFASNGDLYFTDQGMTGLQDASGRVYRLRGSGPDGMAMDEDDNLAICHVGFGTVWLFSRLGEPLYRIKSGAGLATTNCAYGGRDRKSLFITESATGSVLRAELPVAGRAMYSHQ